MPDKIAAMVAPPLFRPNFGDDTTRISSDRPASFLTTKINQLRLSFFTVRVFVRSFSSILAAPMAAPNKNDRYFLHGHLQYSTKDQKENLHYPRDLIAWTETRRVV